MVTGLRVVVHVLTYGVSPRYYRRTAFQQRSSTPDKYKNSTSHDVKSQCVNRIPMSDIEVERV